MAPPPIRKWKAQPRPISRGSDGDAWMSAWAQRPCIRPMNHRPTSATLTPLRMPTRAIAVSVRSISTVPKMPPRKVRAKVFMEDSPTLNGGPRPWGAGGGLRLTAGTVFGRARIRTWRRSSSGRTGTERRRHTRLGWRARLRPGWRRSGSRSRRTRPGRSCRCRGWIAGYRSRWISWVARRRDVIDGFTFGAAPRFRQAIATSCLRVCRTGRAYRPSGSDHAMSWVCQVEPSRVRSSSSNTTVRAWLRPVAGSDGTAGRNWLAVAGVVGDRGWQRRQRAVAHV